VTELLQGGRGRRRRLRPRRRRDPSRVRRGGSSRLRAAGFGLLGLLATAAVLLALMDARASGPTAVRVHGPSASGTTASAGQAIVTRTQYGVRPAPPSERVTVHLKLHLRSGLLFDVRTGQVLWQLHPDDVVPIASLTKMMTALIVVAHSRISDHVLITPAAVHFSGSGVGLLPVHKDVPELALLYGLLLPSGNDAAIALAQHVAGTRSRFIAMMNARARQLGLGCTHFNTVSGIVDAGNHSCAADLALIAHAVVQQPLLGRIVATRSAIVPFPIKGRKLYLYNNNPLLVTGYPGADGVKTGYTTASGPCLVATARRGRAWLGVVVLNSANTIAQAEALLNAGFAKLRSA
jgi:serine-type D-Ala-D-Ala carboxypeptidase (penicillin-binding protein 5/6)